MIAYALVPREEPRRFVVVDGRYPAHRFEPARDWPAFGAWRPAGEIIVAKGHVYEGEWLGRLLFFYASEDNARAAQVLIDLSCGMLFCRWLFEVVRS